MSLLSKSLHRLIHTLKASSITPFSEPQKSSVAIQTSIFQFIDRNQFLSIQKATETFQEGARERGESGNTNGARELR